MRFLTLLIAAQTLVAIALATPVPAGDMPMPMPTMDKCNSCLVTNIRKMKACKWWNQNNPWLEPGDWSQAQKDCVCALSSDYGWLNSCDKPNYCSQGYAGWMKDMYGQWKTQMCDMNGGN